MPRRAPVHVGIPKAERERVLKGARSLERTVARRGEGVAGGGADLEKTIGMRGNPRVRDRDGAEMRQTTLHLPVTLMKRLGRYCVDTERGMNDSIVDAISDYLDARGISEEQ